MELVADLSLFGQADLTGERIRKVMAAGHVFHQGMSPPQRGQGFVVMVLLELLLTLRKGAARLGVLMSEMQQQQGRRCCCCHQDCRQQSPQGQAMWPPPVPFAPALDQAAIGHAAEGLVIQVAAQVLRQGGRGGVAVGGVVGQALLEDVGEPGRDPRVAILQRTACTCRIT